MQNKTEKTPFFARFLEDQKTVDIKTGVAAGGGTRTMKWPSDGDEI